MERLFGRLTCVFLGDKVSKKRLLLTTSIGNIIKAYPISMGVLLVIGGIGAIIMAIITGALSDVLGIFAGMSAIIFAIILMIVCVVLSVISDNDIAY